MESAILANHDIDTGLCLYSTAMEPKKISFGFSKKLISNNLLSKKASNKEETGIELIKCLEEQSIVVLNEKPKEVYTPLIIPLKDATKTSTALASLKRRQEILDNVENVKEEPKADILKTEIVANETIEQRAARELLEQTKNQSENEVQDIGLTLPLKADEMPLDGAVEPTIDDYEKIPISQYGLAMLRGMGFDGELKKKAVDDLEGPQLRPKGMGLGADKAIRPKPLLIPPEKHEELVLKKNACVRLLVGKFKDLYGQIESLDDHAGRVLVKMALGGHRDWFSEFMVQPVSKKEYAEYGKVLNSAKYEKYKEEQARGNVVVKNEKIEDQKPEYSHIKREKYKEYSPERHERLTKEIKKESRYKEYSNKDFGNSDEKTRHSRQGRDSGKNDDRRRGGESSRTYYNSDDSSDSQSGRRRTSKKHSKSHKHRNFRSSSSEDDKRHKKKTKKSKKPRSRSRERK